MTERTIENNKPISKAFTGEDMPAIDEASRLITFTISTNEPDRSNDIVNINGWKFENFNKNPIFLWAHDKWAPPIGKVKSIFIDGMKLKATVEFMTADISPFAESIFQMYKRKFMNAVSVGFIPLKWSYNKARGEYAVDFDEQELVELSAVPVPANAQCVQDSVDDPIVKSYLEAVKSIEKSEPQKPEGVVVKSIEKSEDGEDMEEMGGKNPKNPEQGMEPVEKNTFQKCMQRVRREIAALSEFDGEEAMQYEAEIYRAAAMLKALLPSPSKEVATVETKSQDKIEIDDAAISEMAAKLVMSKTGRLP